MKVEEIKEPVEVVALFRFGRLLPLKFRWKERVYRVCRVNGDWKSEQGRTRFHHFAVSSEGQDVYELSFNQQAYDWRIERVSLAG